jgi:Tat protein secretion system quality control protein TatD with DNase activity
MTASQASVPLISLVTSHLKSFPPAIPISTIFSIDTEYGVLQYPSAAAEMLDETLRDDTGDDSWQTGFFDAHCHPTDTMSSIDDIPKMKAKVLTIMATRREDQDLVESVAARFPLNGNDELKSVVPAFGWHPWFSYQIFDDRSTSEKPSAIVHYRSVLTPNVEDEAFLQALPEPKSLKQFLAETEDRLRRHPFALVGEVGLDRSFRLPKVWLPHELDSRDALLTPGSREGRRLSPCKVQLAHQKLILEAQLRLAAKLQRPASIHSVQAHGAVLEVLQSLWSGHEKMSSRQRKRRSSAAGAHTTEDDEPPTLSSNPLPFPPRICMHSYSGPADFLREFLHHKVPVDVYFSFSDIINFSGPSSDKVVDVVKSIPDSKILIESDLHCAGVEMDARLSSVFQSICDIKRWSSEEGIKILARNWRRFVFGD